MIYNSKNEFLTLHVKNQDKNKKQKITVTFSRYISLKECKNMLSEILKCRVERIFFKNGPPIEDISKLDNFSKVYITSQEVEELDYYKNHNSNIFQNKTSQQYQQSMITQLNQDKIKICLIGSKQVGKTQILNRFKWNSYSEDYIPTYEDSIQFKYKFFASQYDTYDFEPVVQQQNQIEVQKLLQIYDTSGDPELIKCRNQWIFNCGGIILVFSFDNLQSFLDIKRLLSQFEDNNEWKNKKIIIMGNKADIKQKLRKVQDEEIADLVEKYKDIDYIEVSAKRGQFINEAFQQLIAQIYDSQQRDLNFQSFDSEQNVPNYIKDSLISKEQIKRKQKKIGLFGFFKRLC